MNTDFDNTILDDNLDINEEESHHTAVRYMQFAFGFFLFFLFPMSINMTHSQARLANLLGVNDMIIKIILTGLPILGACAAIIFFINLSVDWEKETKRINFQ